MPRVALWQPNLHAFGLPQDDFKLGSRMKDDIVQRGSGRSETGHTFLTSFIAGASGVAVQVAPTTGREVGVARLQYNIPPGGGASAAVGYGYTGGNAPWRLDPNYDYTFTAKVRCANLIFGGGTLVYEFLGMGNSANINSDFTNAVGFIRDPTTFSGSLWRFEPICRSSGVSTRIASNQSIILHTSDPTGGVYRSFMWRASHNGTDWVVTFYKLWDDKNTTGSAGEWINLGSITTNVPTTNPIGFFHQCIFTSSTVGTSGTCEYFLDYVTFEQRNKNVWRFAQ